MNPAERASHESKSLLINKSLPSNQTAFQKPREENVNYYQESCRLYIANVILTSQMKELLAEKSELVHRIKTLEKKIQENNCSSTLADEKRKRNRRSANEIQKHYKCPVEKCSKSYGSEGSMLQHIKLKHGEIGSEEKS